MYSSAEKGISNFILLYPLLTPPCISVQNIPSLSTAIVSGSLPTNCCLDFETHLVTFCGQGDTANAVVLLRSFCTDITASHEFQRRLDGVGLND